MGKPSEKNCVCIITSPDEKFSIRLARVGKGPLVEIWVHEDGHGGRGMILDVEDSDIFIEEWQDLLDEIEENS